MIVKTLLLALAVTAVGALFSLLGTTALGLYLCFVLVCCTRYLAAKTDRIHQNIKPNNNQEEDNHEI